VVATEADALLGAPTLIFSLYINENRTKCEAKGREKMRRDERECEKRDFFRKNKKNKKTRKKQERKKDKIRSEITNQTLFNLLFQFLFSNPLFEHLNFGDQNSAARIAPTISRILSAYFFASSSIHHQPKPTFFNTPNTEYLYRSLLNK